MHIRKRATLSLVFGSLSVFLQALVWTFMVRSELLYPPKPGDQGGSWMCFTPLALFGAVACAVPAALLAGRGVTCLGGRESWSVWRVTAVGLSTLGLMLAMGTCIGPAVLAGALR